MSFVHLHVHTQYSVLDGASAIPKLFAEAQRLNMPALAITDHGNMFGVKEFLNTAAGKFPDIKPIVGCEVYVANGSRTERKGREERSSFHLILLAKNLNGYHNLIKLVSKGYIEGFYYYPRIDHELLEQYHEDLICSCACLGGEIPQALMNDNWEEACRLTEWYHNLFGDDFYLEVMRHKSKLPEVGTSTFEKQEKVNEGIFRLGEKYGIKVIATNDVHFVQQSDGPAHDRLICLITNKPFDSPDRLRYTQEEYLKSPEEMAELFADHPETLTNTLEIADKVEVYSLDSKPIMPHFEIPEEFADSDDYLRYLTYEGAKKRYGELTEVHTERLDFELATIKRMGFPDYFLIVQDFIIAARKMGVSVGPGRGSAAGSAVAYCLTITDIDPIKYDLLFERFLNPDRISMPDIDVDFDDDGRYKVFKYVEDKYGKDHISHVVTFGTMGTKSVIRDVARIQNLPLQTADKLAKAVPKAITIEKEVEVEDPNDPTKKIKKKEKKDVNPTIGLCVKHVPEFIDAMNSEDANARDTLIYAEKLEGNVRNTGVHACALIIGREDLTNYIPISTAKDKDSGADILVSQYEGSLIESVGLLKMDFLGLRTLSIIKEALANIRQSRGIQVDIDHIPLDDAKTYELFGRGDTVAIFQFESDGMQKWLRELQPSRFEDLIAMNALYRPGPMDYIPDFVARKHGTKAIEYDLPDMEEYLHDTYGVTVYQEQVMLLSQKLAGFTKGQADKLRKAMGKKQLSVMAELREKFFEGGIQNGHPEPILDKIWNDWKAFAQYAFNKSHATCYAWVGYQTGYLKAHYPAEFMAATLSKNLNNMEELTKFMSDCRRQHLDVLGPDINESFTNFTVNKDGKIRFGLGGIKGVGAAIIQSIIQERETNGPFRSLYDLAERVPSSILGRKMWENLAAAGAFDSFEGVNRGTLFAPCGNEVFAEVLSRYAASYQRNIDSMANSLFGGVDSIEIAQPPLPSLPQIDRMESLRREKELVGMYLSAHPLDELRFELEHFTSITVAEMADVRKEAEGDSNFHKKEYVFGGMVSAYRQGLTKTNRPFGSITLEDFSGSMEMGFFGKTYERFLPFLQEGTMLLIKAVFLQNKDEDASGCRMQIDAMCLLNNTKEAFIKEVLIKLPVEHINPDFRKRLTKMLRKSKGKSALTLYVTDRQNDLAVEFVSRKFRITPTVELLDFLEAENLPYRIRHKVSFQ